MKSEIRQLKTDLIMPNYILLQEVASTNSTMKRIANTLADGTVLQAYAQTAGRGQKGNSWEAEPGKNATFSQMIRRPRLDVKKQFFLSEAVSLAIVDTLEKYATGFTIKWPNDIYHADNKVCGILIEQSLDQDGIDYAIVGVGVNINQHFFISDAPNPTSLYRITGKEHDVMDVTRSICEKIEEYCRFDGTQEQLNALHERYLSKLYRYDGKPHLFTTPQGQQFEAIIEAVHPDGTLTLRHIANDTTHDYLFKQVGFVINKVKFL